MSFGTRRSYFPGSYARGNQSLLAGQGGGAEAGEGRVPLPRSSPLERVPRPSPAQHAGLTSAPLGTAAPH